MPRTLLIVDDIKSNREILKNILGDEYAIEEASHGREAIAVMTRNFDMLSAVLLDLRMPVMDGFEVLTYMRGDRMLSQLPVIVMTGQSDANTEEQALKLGAKDYISKPYKSAIIKQRIWNTINLRETAAAVNALQRDPLTGLYSREAFMRLAGSMVASHAPGYYVMACFDVDKFKMINDQYGTRKGDAVLRHIADVFQKGFEAFGGLCCRVSADHFAVLYPASFQDTAELAEIRKKAGLMEGFVSPIVFSIGRYLVDDPSLSPSAMYDRAMMAADSIKGRYDVQIARYDESLRNQILQVQQIVTDMGAALVARQFEVWYQPQYNHSTGAMIGAEALVRWRHPQKGLISPGIFIPVFEKTGFIYTLDKYVWEEACRFLQKELRDGKSPLPVSVNISRHDVFHDDIVDVILGLAKEYGIPTDLLRLEITESAFTESTKEIVSVVKRLVECGFMLEIDDFGSSYSSLNTLKSVPAQVVKLDMRFLEDDDDSQRGGNIIESVVRMTKWLGMSVIAEGVEKKTQADFLKSIGCNYVQGYLYAKPMPEDAFRALSRGASKEEKLLALETVENLDNNSFWNPESMDTLIFNSYVGAACIFEFYEGKIEMLRATEKFAQILSGAGMTVKDALALNWIDYFDESSREKVLENLTDSVETMRENTDEYVFVNLPGCPRKTYLRTTMRVIASAGRRYLVYCANENITAQCTAEQREHKTAEQLQAVMDNVACGITAVSIDGETVTYLLANDKYFQLLGYTKQQYRDEIETDAFSTLFHEDRAATVETIRRVAVDKKPRTVEYRIVRRNGDIIWLRSNISMAAFDGVAGEVQLSTYTDITEQKQAALDLLNTSAQLHTMMDDIPGGFCRIHVLTDGGMEPVYINDGLCNLTGMNRDEVKARFARGMLSGVHPDDVAIAKETTARMLQNGKARSARYRLRRQDGGYVWLSVFGRATKDAQGDVYLNIYYTDATGQVQAEEQRKELLDNLPYGAALYEYDGKSLYVIHLNKRYWELVNRKEVAYSGSAFLRAVCPEDQSVIRHEVETAIQENRDIACDIRVLYGEKEYRPFHIVGRILQKEDGRYSIYAAYTPISNEAMSIQQMLPIALSAMMDCQTGCSFVKDRHLRYICCSREVASFVGLSSPAEIQGKTDHELFDASVADSFVAADRRVMENGEAVLDYTARIPAADGSIRYASTSKFPLKDPQGNIVGVYGVGRDVTQSRAMQSQFELLTNSIPGGIATYEYRGGKISLLYFNDGFCSIFGLTREAYSALSQDDVFVGVFADDVPALREQLDALVRENAQADCVYRVRQKDGAHKWINFKASAAERDGDRVVFNAVLLDVTQRQETMERMRISEEENRLAMQHTRNAVCRYDVVAGILRIPDSVQKEFSLPAQIDNVPYGPIERGMISPDTIKAYKAFYEGIHAGDETGAATFQRMSNRGWRWLEAHYSTIYSDTGEPVSAVISFVDITEQLEKDSAYKRWQQSFQNKAPESYSLFRCNLRYKTAFSAREGLLLDIDFGQGNLCFDDYTAQYAEQCVFEDDRERFRAFLSADALLSDYYKGKRIVTIEYREALSDGGVRWLRLTVDLVEHVLSADVEAYLLFEDIDKAKKLELATIEQAETDPLTGVMNRVTFASHVNNIIKTSTPNMQHALMMLDMDGFKQVNDAFGHGAGDQLLIDLAKSMRTALRHNDLVGRLGGDEFLIFLTDIPGEVIAAQKARQICALTRKAFSAEVEISGSVGIAIAPRDGTDFDALYKKVDAALYHVKGSGKDNFAFYHDDIASEHVLVKRVPSPSEATQTPRKKRRMLIVDDNRIDHAMLSNIFADQFIIEKATDGNTALIRLRHYGSALSVVLLDLVMPGLDGFAVLKKMQESAELRNVPVIVVSSDENRETSLRAIREGAVDFVSKPVDPEILCIRVQSAISKAENERLRAKNSLLEYQGSEIKRYQTALEQSGVVVIENDWVAGTFTYDAFISRHIAGTYDSRNLWHILLSDLVTDTLTVQRMQGLVQSIAADRKRSGETTLVQLKTPAKARHWFRMNIYKATNEFGLAGKIYLTFIDLDAERSMH